MAARDTHDQNHNTDDLHQHNSKDWFAIGGAVVTSLCLSVLGFIVAVNGDPTTGMTLAASGGLLLIFSLMAALGKSRMVQALQRDAPPSYRRSWRDSFLRRHPSFRRRWGSRRQRRGSAGPQRSSLARAAHHEDGAAQVHAAVHHHNHTPLQPDQPHTNNPPALHNPPQPLDHTQSSLQDPPCYQAAVANMDEAVIRKIESEII